MKNYFQVKDIKLSIPKITKDIKITCLSDLHFSHLIGQTKLDEIRDKILSYQSDYICIVGDLLDFSNIIEEKEKLKQIKNWLIHLSKIPTIMVLGNHDINALSNKKWNYSFPTDFVDQMNDLDNIYILDNIWKSNTGLISPDKKLFPKNARGILFIGDKEIPLIISGGITKLQETAPKIFHYLNPLFPMSIENITLTGHQKVK